MVKDEENYHVTQLEGNADANLTADLWNDVAVMNTAATIWWASGSAAFSVARVNQGVLATIVAENNRSNNMFIYPRPRRCALEKLAKINTGIKYGYHFPCAYSLCPQN
ncbi:MAG: hypothetical protein NTX03_05925 [Bacteroidetes bacterium]|nr:hypothetical protein [Bacteroidota bacterium]